MFFHALGPYNENIKPEQVRSALTTIIKRQYSDENFNKNGWLKLGFKGHQK